LSSNSNALEYINISLTQTNQNYSDYQQMIFYRVTVWGRALSNMGNSATYSHSKIYINNTPPTKEGGGGFAYSVVGLGGV